MSKHKSAEASSDWTIEKAQQEVPTESDGIDSEIAYCEERLKALRAAQVVGTKQEFPKFVYKGGGEEAIESQVVNSQDELDALGAGWGEKADCDQKNAEYKKKGH